MLYNILKDQWQTIEIDRIRSITQETEFSQMAELLYVIDFIGDVSGFSESQIGKSCQQRNLCVSTTGNN